MLIFGIICFVVFWLGPGALGAIMFLLDEKEEIRSSVYLRWEDVRFLAIFVSAIVFILGICGLAAYLMVRLTAEI